MALLGRVLSVEDESQMAWDLACSYDPRADVLL
jgi:hypothetical protein